MAFVAPEELVNFPRGDSYQLVTVGTPEEFNFSFRLIEGKLINDNGQTDTGPTGSIGYIEFITIKELQKKALIIHIQNIALLPGTFEAQAVMLQKMLRKLHGLLTSLNSFNEVTVSAHFKQDSAAHTLFERALEQEPELDYSKKTMYIEDQPAVNYVKELKTFSQ